MRNIDGLSAVIEIFGVRARTVSRGYDRIVLNCFVNGYSQSLGESQNFAESLCA